MQGPLAQMVALTCYGNAAISGCSVTPFFPGHSTCTFCESVRFVAAQQVSGGGFETVAVAGSPDEWIQYLLSREMLGLRLRLLQRAQNHPHISDRMSAGFVGGGRQWKIEVLRRDGASEFWFGKWEIGNKNAPDRRIWQVTYGLCEIAQTEAVALRSLKEITEELRPALKKIHAFSERENCGGFTRCFEQALAALNNSQADIGYHKDLFLPNSLSAAAVSLLKATMSAWVFGGMGSWNDMGFDGEVQAEYERLSDRLFNLLNEAIEAAACSSMKTPAAQ
jgi:hypothetical protein